MKNLWMILPYWLFVYVMYRGMCVSVYESFGRALEAMGGPIEDGVESPKLNLKELVLRHMIFLVVAALLWKQFC
jgi:hypothetical protein